MRTPKLIRDITAITDNPDLHFWIKCKELTQIETYNRPGSWEGNKLKRVFFETCAGRFKNRFESAYVRPYLDNWSDDYNAHDYVAGKDLNNDLTCKIGRRPRGIKDIAKKPDSQERFANYIREKYPDAFEEFEEIKKVHYGNGSETQKTSDCAWQHIFYHRVRSRPYLSFHGDNNEKALWQTPKETQLNRRKFDQNMEMAQKEYNKLKKASGLPPRYLYNEVSLAELQNDHKNHTYARFRCLHITTETVLNYDDSEVHHGLGKLVRTDRKVVIRNKRGVAFSKILKAYSGNFVLNAIEEYLDFKVKKKKVHEKLKPVQLNPKMRVVEKINTDNQYWNARISTNSILRIRIFERMFAGIHYDYCALRDGITYHGSSIEQCIKGWKKKKALSKTGATVLNMKAARALGFCQTGIRQFCNTNNIDSHDDYTIEELRAIVNKNLSYNKDYYGRELRQVGIL